MLSYVYWPGSDRFAGSKLPDFFNTAGGKLFDIARSAKRIIGIRPCVQMNDTAVLAAGNQSNGCKSSDHSLLGPP